MYMYVSSVQILDREYDEMVSISIRHCNTSAESQSLNFLFPRTSLSNSFSSNLPSSLLRNPLFKVRISISSSVRSSRSSQPIKHACPQPLTLLKRLLHHIESVLSDFLNHLWIRLTNTGTVALYRYQNPLLSHHESASRVWYEVRTDHCISTFQTTEWGYLMHACYNQDFSLHQEAEIRHVMMDKIGRRGRHYLSFYPLPYPAIHLLQY